MVSRAIRIGVVVAPVRVGVVVGVVVGGRVRGAGVVTATVVVALRYVGKSGGGEEKGRHTWEFVPEEVVL